MGTPSQACEEIHEECRHRIENGAAGSCVVRKSAAQGVFYRLDFELEIVAQAKLDPIVTLLLSDVPALFMTRPLVVACLLTINSLVDTKSVPQFSKAIESLPHAWNLNHPPA